MEQIMRSLTITLGPPGTGKTTTMLNKIEHFLEQGIPPERIAFVSYTKKAVMEAAERAATRFNLSRKRFINFRTIHSTCYHGLNVSRNQVMNKEDYAEIGKMLGLSFSGHNNADEGVMIGEDSGDYMLQLINLSHAVGTGLRSIWESIDRDLDWHRLLQLHRTLQTYKADTGKIDFDDMLKNFIIERPLVDVDAVIIDEAQDLSNAQWDVAKIAFRKAKYIEVAGDDDQAIYAWSGANVQRFMALKGETTILNQSYRIPRAVHKLSHSIIKQVGQRLDKAFAAKDEQGSVQYATSCEIESIGNGESWLLLSRNACYLKEYSQMCELKGIPYTYRGRESVNHDHVRAIVLWERVRKGTPLSPEDEQFIAPYKRHANTQDAWYDALKKIPLVKREYYLSILRAGYRLQDPAQVHINTIHGVKGGEADNVALMTDMTTRSYDSMQLNADNEHRVFYVGATRARNNLHIIQAQTTRGYLI